MRLFSAFPGRASAIMSLLGVLASPLQLAVAGEGAKPMGRVAQTIDEPSPGHESHAPTIAIEMHIQAEIIRRFRQRAESGETEALLVLGHVYETGRGTPQDFVLAHKWYNLAAAHGSQAGAHLRDEIASKMTPDLVLEAQRMAREWLAAQHKGQSETTVSELNF